jgi:CDP-paratose 2-epimerase
MAAQVAVTTSLKDPAEDFEVNLRGTLNLLEALRQHNPDAPLVFASTNKVYGDLGDVAMLTEAEHYAPANAAIAAFGINEDRPLDFHTPYGCSKGAADQYVLDYARSFGLRACVLRMSCIYGPRQMGTEDQGWVAHFLIRALKGEPINVYGDGKQVRDILDVSDAVEAYLTAWRKIDAVQGRAFNLGGGPANAVSLRQVLAEIERIIGRRVATEFADWRTGDQRYYVSDTRRVTQALDIGAPRPWREGIAALADWLAEAHGTPAEPPRLYAEALS